MGASQSSQSDKNKVIIAAVVTVTAISALAAYYALKTNDTPKNATSGVNSDGSSSSSLASAAAAASGAKTPQTQKEEALKYKTEGNEAFKQKRYTEAAEKYTQALDTYTVKDKTCAVFYANRAACYLSLEVYDKVIKDCTAALTLDPTYAKAFNRRAKAYAATGQKQKAVYDYSAVCFIEKFTKSESVETLDKNLKDLGREVAEKIIQSRTPAMPSRTSLSVYFEGFSEDLSLQEKESATTLNGLIKQSPSDGLLYFRRSVALLKAGRYEESFQDVEEACEHLEKIPEAASNKDELVETLWRARNLRATYLHLRGQDSLALQAFDEILEARPDDVNAILKRCTVLSDLGKQDQVLEQLDRAKAVAPEHSDVYYHRGQHFFATRAMAQQEAADASGDLVKAEEEFQKAVDLKTKSYSPYVQLAVTKYKLGKRDQALKLFDNVLEDFKSTPDVYVYAAQLYIDMNNIKKANELLDKAINLDKKCAMAYFYKAVLCMSGQQQPDGDKLKDSEKLLNKAIDSDERFEGPYQQLAQLALQQGKLDDAVDYYDKCLPLMRTVDEIAVISACREAALAQKFVLKNYPTLPMPGPM